jgi:murein L,D-transpeptidase YafK
MSRIFLITLCLTIVALPAFSQSPAAAHALVVKKSKFMLDVTLGDSVIKTLPIALGKNPGDKQKRGDNRTPEGKFTIV